MNNLDILHIPAFLDFEEQYNLLAMIKSHAFNESFDSNLVNDKPPMPRLIKWYGNKEYAYSTINHPALQIPDYIEPILDKINNFLEQEKLEHSLNSVLINYYRDGNDKINYHSDDLSQIGENPVIASLSLGDSRTFKFKHKTTKEKLDFILNAGDLFIMFGNTQQYWQHAVLPEPNKKERINCTFRNTKYNPK